MSVLKAIIIVLQAWTIKATLPNKKRVAKLHSSSCFIGWAYIHNGPENGRGEYKVLVIHNRCHKVLIRQNWFWTTILNGPKSSKLWCSRRLKVWGKTCENQIVVFEALGWQCPTHSTKNESFFVSCYHAWWIWRGNSKNSNSFISSYPPTHTQNIFNVTLLWGCCRKNEAKGFASSWCFLSLFPLLASNTHANSQVFRGIFPPP